MKSRFVVSLELRRERALSKVDAAFFDAEIAGYLARRGDLQPAREIIDDIRAQHSILRNSRLLAQLNFVEGVVAHCSGIDADAVLKWRRAAAIAETDDLVETMAKVSGWLAFVHYTNGRFDAMLDELKNSFDYHRRSPASGVLTPRARMLVALVFHTCRKTEEALLWYEASREAILAVGDDVELAALVHNMAWIRLYNHRNALLRGQSVPLSESALLRASAEAVQSYEELVGLSSFPALTPLLRAQNFILSNDFSLALEILDTYAESVREQGLKRLAPNFNADRAYCLAKLGQADAACDIVESLAGDIDSSIHVDDLAVLYSRFRDCASLSGKHAQSAQFESVAKRSWQAFDGLIEVMLKGVTELISEGSPQSSFELLRRRPS